MRITPRLVDWMLYNLNEWRRMLELVEPKTSASVILLPVQARNGSPVEHVAVKRADLRLVIDCVELAVKSMPPLLRTIVRMKYRERATHRMMASKLHYSERTIDRKVEAVRLRVARALTSIDPEKLSSFCREIDAFLSAS